MLQALLDAQEPLIRVGTFLAVFVVMALWEVLAPRRLCEVRRLRRWPHNLALLLVDVLLVRIVVPGAAIAVAVMGETQGWGLFNSVNFPSWLAVAIAILFLDLVIYFQHVTFHAVPVLWRLHRVHHSDTELDVTTGTRFHPIEILISTAFKCAAVAAIGAPPVAVFIFELLLNATAVFNHSNANIPSPVDRFLRWFVVTPDMHRVHHSISYNESSSNFGFNTPWWDRILGTYRAQPRDGHEGMVLGVDAFRAVEDCRIERLLVQPILNTPGRYPINRRVEPGAT
jgi:sterol desaturase/sphingolipid hydroxylase (fatty acid hydroxylase superfamily)